MNLIQEHKGKAITSSLLILVPMAAGLLLWKKLPASMVVHWGAGNVADGSGTKAFAVFAIPLLLLAIHWLCLLITARDPGMKNQNRKATGLIFWIMPMVSLGCSAFLYSAALGYEPDSGRAMLVLFAVLFILLGNYMPKVTRNTSYGIKTIWAIHDSENWAATHRFGGKLWVAGGFVLLAAMLLPEKFMVIVLVIDLAILGAAPLLYSWQFHRKQIKAGKPADMGLSKKQKTSWLVSTLILVLLLAGFGILMFVGNIRFTVGDDALAIDADFHTDLTVSYSEIESIEYRPEDLVGSKANGFNSAKLCLGTFRNDEFGLYTRYSYNRSESCIVIQGGGEVLVLADRSTEATLALYEALEAAIR